MCDWVEINPMVGSMVIFFGLKETPGLALLLHIRVKTHPMAKPMIVCWVETYPKAGHMIVCWVGIYTGS